MGSYITVGNVVVGHFLPPLLQQQVAVLLVEGARIGQETSGQQNISNKAFDLTLEESAALRPPDLQQRHDWRTHPGSEA